MPALFEADPAVTDFIFSSFRKARSAYPDPSQAALEAALSGIDAGAAGFRPYTRFAGVRPE
jgi:hypothetical protein